MGRTLFLSILAVENWLLVDKELTFPKLVHTICSIIDPNMLILLKHVVFLFY